MNDPKRVLVVVLALILISLGAFGIKHHIDSAGYKKQVNYTTAIKATDQDNFNYIVDSQQGRVLVNGDFSTVKSKQAQFPEMNKGFAFVSRDKEHYTQHTRQNCTTDSDGDQHCTTETYYTWDTTETQELYADKISFMGRNYPTALFNLSSYKKDTDACPFTAAGSGQGFFENKKGCIDGDFYLGDDDRYSYNTVGSTFNATFLATTYGGLKPFEESSISLENKSVKQVLHDVGRYQLISFWVLVSLLIGLTIAAAISAYSWVMADGGWSLEE